MNIKLKKWNGLWNRRLKGYGMIRDIIVHDDLQRGKELVRIHFKGSTASGIIELNSNEAKKLADALKEKTNLIKGFEKFNFG